ncbi:MAG: sortase [Chordicoccus sp.]
MWHLPSAELFTNIDRMKEGDTFKLIVLGRVITYEVDQISVVLPNEVQNLQIEDGKNYCTLVTCTPYGINTHRLLVRGKWISTELEKDADGEPSIDVSDGAVNRMNLMLASPYVNGDPTQGYTYDVIADMAGKFSTQSYKGYEVRKVWKDTPDEKRPVSVTVDIVAVKDGVETPYQTVTLSDKNNWTYKWVVDAEDATTFKIHEEITDSSFTWTLDWDTDQDNLAVATLTNRYVTPPETPTPTPKTPTPTVKTPTPTAKTPTPTVKTPTPRTGRTPTPPVRTSTHTTTAKTGDTSHIALWIALMAAAVAAILVVVFRGRRKDE